MLIFDADCLLKNNVANKNSKYKKRPDFSQPILKWGKIQEGNLASSSESLLFTVMCLDASDCSTSHCELPTTKSNLIL